MLAHSRSLVSFHSLGQVKAAPRSFCVTTVRTSLLSSFLLPVEMLWYRGKRREEREKKRWCGKRRQGKSNRDRERKGGRGSGTNFQGPPPLPVNVPLLVSHVSWLSCASTLARLGSKPPWLCQGIIIPILWLSSRGGSFFSFGPHPKPVHRCLCACLLPGSWFLLTAVFFGALSTATGVLPLPLVIPALPQTHFPLLLSPCGWVLHSWSKESQGLCSRKPPCPPWEDEGGIDQRSEVRVLGTSNQLMTQ